MSELDDWNPMAEDFACPKFNSYESPAATQELDERSLYIKGIPATLSEEAFIALMSENNREVIRCKLFPPRHNPDITTGVAAFKLAKDAAQVMQLMNKKPPLNMEITYAHRKKTSARGDCPSTTSRKSSSHSFVPSAASGAVPSLGGRGRGSSLNDALKFPALTVVLDGEKRSSFALHSSEIVSTPPSDLPQLVENPFLKCLSCENVGKFSCAACKRPYCSSSCQVKDWPNHKLSCTNKRSRDSSYVSESSGSDSEKKSLPAPPKSLSAPKATGKQDASQVVKIIDIKTEVLPKDKRLKVKVSHIVKPSKFWVQTSSAQDRLSQMERDLALFAKQQPPPSLELGHVYCIHQHGSCKRAALLKIIDDRAASVQFLDYGSTDTIQTNKLFLLPSAFKEIPYQAIPCKLGDTGEEKEVDWSEDDTTYFQMHTSNNRFYAAHVLKHFGDGSYEVNLSNEEGISLYSIISVFKNSSSVEVKESVRSSEGPKQPSIPSVLSKLKAESKCSIAPAELFEDQMWCIMDEVSGTLENDTKELNRILKSLDSKDYSL